jgi:hypothetical protein
MRLEPLEAPLRSAYPATVIVSGLVAAGVGATPVEPGPTWKELTPLVRVHRDRREEPKRPSWFACAISDPFEPLVRPACGSALDLTASAETPSSPMRKPTKEEQHEQP